MAGFMLILLQLTDLFQCPAAHQLSVAISKSVTKLLLWFYHLQHECIKVEERLVMGR